MSTPYSVLGSFGLWRHKFTDMIIFVPDPAPGSAVQYSSDPLAGFSLKRIQEKYRELRFRHRMGEENRCRDRALVLGGLERGECRGNSVKIWCLFIERSGGSSGPSKRRERGYMGYFILQIQITWRYIPPCRYPWNLRGHFRRTHTPTMRATLTPLLPAVILWCKLRIREQSTGNWKNISMH